MVEKWPLAGAYSTRNSTFSDRAIAAAAKLLILLWVMVAPSGIEPELFALRGRRVNQLHHGAVQDGDLLHSI